MGYVWFLGFGGRRKKEGGVENKVEVEVEVGRGEKKPGRRRFLSLARIFSRSSLSGCIPHLLISLCLAALARVRTCPRQPDKGRHRGRGGEPVGVCLSGIGNLLRERRHHRRRRILLSLARAYTPLPLSQFSSLTSAQTQKTSSPSSSSPKRRKRRRNLARGSSFWFRKEVGRRSKWESTTQEQGAFASLFF